MANMQCATVSSGAQLHDDHEIDRIRDAYDLGGLSLEVEDGKVSLHGYNVLAIHDNQERRCDTRFLTELAEQLADGEELIIQSVGFTKLRFPAHAVQYKLKSGEVTKDSLGGDEQEITVSL